MIRQTTLRKFITLTSRIIYRVRIISVCQSHRRLRTRWSYSLAEMFRLAKRSRLSGLHRVHSISLARGQSRADRTQDRAQSPRRSPTNLWPGHEPEHRQSIWTWIRWWAANRPTWATAITAHPQSQLYPARAFFTIKRNRRTWTGSSNTSELTAAEATAALAARTNIASNFEYFCIWCFVEA